MQRRAAPVLLSASDAVIQSETGSGKTGAFLLPSLSRLAYPPERYVEDMKGPQLLVLVPTFELGTQVGWGFRPCPCLGGRCCQNWAWKEAAGRVPLSTGAPAGVAAANDVL